MPELERVAAHAVDALADEAFAGLGCSEYGIAVLRGAGRWEADAHGCIAIPTRNGVRQVPIAHDERGAPYAVGPDGKEDATLLLSLTDEDDLIACAWARVTECSPVVGVGVDLCGTARFELRPKRHDLAHLLLTEREREIAPGLVPEDRARAYAALFAAKEAAFKATAAPLRRWYDTHDEKLLFEVRHFVMEEPGRELGTGRNGVAQQATDQMGIRAIAVHHTAVDDAALVVCCALRET